MGNPNQSVFARFILSAVRPGQYPPDDGLPEVAFLGRSNVGKSSLLNALVKMASQQAGGSGGVSGGKKELAFVSSTPGRTQTINFYLIGEALRFADLPGYGFAKVPSSVTGEWRRLVEDYLGGRTSLRLCLLLLDARRGWMDKDRELKDWLEFHRRPFAVAVTKMDKLSANEQRRALAEIQREVSGNQPVHPCSTVSGRGVRELWHTIWKTRTT